MIGSRVLILLAALGFGLCLNVYGQSEEEARIIEQDHLITSADERRGMVTQLLNTSSELRKAGRVIEAARILNRAGGFQMRMSAYGQAVSTFEKARTLLKQGSDQRALIDSLNGIASGYENLSQCDRSEQTANQAIALSQQAGYVAGHAEAALTASFCQNTRDNVLALKSAQESLELWRSLNHKRGMAETYSAIGQYYLVQSNLDKSSESCAAALRLFRDLNDSNRQAAILISFGFIEFRKGAWQNAMVYYTQAQALIDEKAEPFQMGRIQGNLAEAFLEVGLPEVALEKSRRAREYFEQTNNARAITAMNWSIGRSYYFSGKYEEAIQSFESARREAASRQDTRLTAFCDEYLGLTHAALKNTPLALKYFEAALAEYSSAKNPMEAARTRSLMGSVYEEEGKIESARQCYLAAVQSFRALSDRINESATLFASGRLELKQKNLDLAEQYLRESIEVTEHIRRTSTTRDLTTALSASLHGRYLSYIECLMRKHELEPARGFDIRAFETSEAERARSLAELLRATQSNPLANLDPKLAEQEKALRQTLRVKEDKRVALLAVEYKKEDLEELDSELAQLGANHNRVVELINARYPGYGALIHPQNLNLQEIQSQVVRDDETLLIEYVLGAERSYVWAVTRNSISSYELPGRVEIENQVHRFYQLITASQTEAGATRAERQKQALEVETQLPEITASLSQTLLGPIADKLLKKRLVIVADGALQYIPFQALSLPSAVDAEQKPLVVDHEIINEPSASILALVLRESANRKPASRSVAVLADPVFGSDDPRLAPQKPGETVLTSSFGIEQLSRAFRDVQSASPQKIPRLLATREEARAIMAVIPEGTGFEATDFRASRSTVAGSGLDQYSIVHFATHAFVDDKYPESSGIVLSLIDQEGTPQEGFLRTNDIYNLRLPVDLVVLSGCSTGLGKEVKGEGLIGLTRGFMYAGAGGVTASLWKVDDEATAELMKRFYERMFKGGLTPSAALREAQVSMWRENRWHSPYFWAAFVIQGRYDQATLVASPGAQWLVICLGLASLALLIAFVAFGRRRTRTV